MCNMNSPFEMMMRIYPFELYGLKCSSLTSFLESLKFSDKNVQSYVCKLRSVSDLLAIGSISDDWKKYQTLYFRGYPLKRNSWEYLELVASAFGVLCQNPAFRFIVKNVEESHIHHIMLPDNPRITPLTKRELCIIVFQLQKDLIEVDTKELLASTAGATLQ